MPKITTALLLTVGVCSNALAAGWYECDGDKIQWDHDPTMRLADNVTGSAAVAVLVAMNRYNENPTTRDFDSRLGDHGVGRDNGQNEIWFSDNDDILDGAPAIAFPQDDCGDWFVDGDSEIEEMDIVIDEDVDWTYNTLFKRGVSADGTEWAMTAYDDDATDSKRPLVTTIMHELGHALGLVHENREYNIMGSDWTHISANGDWVSAYPGEDAIDGLVTLYTDSPGNEDVGVVHWRRTGRSGAYSTHGRTRICDDDCAGGGAELDKADDDAVEPVYEVDRGTDIWMEFSYENNGSSTQEVGVGFYLSDADGFLGCYMSTWDDRIGGRTLTLARNGVYTKSHRVTLPRDLVRGEDYCIGPIVDEDDDIDETLEHNNATYTHIHVR